MNLCSLPWADRNSWTEINRSIAYLAARYHRALGPVVETARAIQSHVSWLAPLLDDLCRRTCLHCPEPCCLGAKIWFNTADLLMLHLNGLPVPEAQPLKDWDAACRYAGPRGCRLGRLSRPWICTWYLCPPQAAILRRSDEGKRDRFERVVREIKTLRTVMEEGFVHITS